MRMSGRHHAVGNATDPSQHYAVQAVFTAPRAPGADGPSSTLDRAVFVLDTSLSTRGSPHAAYLSLLETVLAANRPGLRWFNVLSFDVGVAWAHRGWLENTEATVRKVVQRIRETSSLQGASDLHAGLVASLAPPSDSAEGELQIPPAERWATYLLSDGVATWGETSQAAIGHRVEE